MTKYQTEQALICHALEGASGSSMRVYTYLRNAQVETERNGRHWIMPRNQTIADDLGRHVRTIQRATKDLVERGLLVVQPRFARLRNGQWWQISNRMRVMVTTAAAVTRTLVVKARASLLYKARVFYKCDISSMPRILALTPKPIQPWQTSEIYRAAMAKGIHKRTV